MAQKRKAIHYCLNECHHPKVSCCIDHSQWRCHRFSLLSFSPMFINLKFEPLDKWSKSSDSIRFVLFWTNSSWKFKEYSNRHFLFVFETLYTSIQKTSDSLSWVHVFFSQFEIDCLFDLIFFVYLKSKQ